MLGTTHVAAALVALALLVTGCHATTGGGQAGYERGGYQAPVVVVPASELGRTVDHLGRRIPGARR